MPIQPIEIERQLTQRRLDVDSYNKSVKEIRASLNNINNSIRDIYEKLSKINSDNYVPKSFTISSRWICNEIPTGAINGSNNTYQLNYTPNPPESLILTKNGQVLYFNIGFTLTDKIITIQADYIYQTGDLIRVWYETT